MRWRAAWRRGPRLARNGAAARLDKEQMSVCLLGDELLVILSVEELLKQEAWPLVLHAKRFCARVDGGADVIHHRILVQQVVSASVDLVEGESVGVLDAETSLHVVKKLPHLPKESIAHVVASGMPTAASSVGVG